MDNIIKVISIVLGSSFLAAYITALFSKKINDRNNSLKYITEERKNWRNFIKKMTVELISTNQAKKQTEIISELYLNLNPYDEDDLKIISVAEKFVNEKSYKEKNKKELLNLVSKLLKHDWERAKSEANSNYWPNKIIIITLIIWFIIRIMCYDSLLIKYIRQQSIFQGVFSKLCWLIIALGIAQILLKFLDKYLLKYSMYKKVRNMMFEVLNIPYREDNRHVI